MSNYIFITEQFAEGPTTYYAISEDRIERLNESDTYGRYGQKVSSSDAGDYLYLNTEKAVEVANRCANRYEEYEEVQADYSIGDTISAYEESALYDDILSAYNAGELTDADIQINKSTVKGFNFWNGHNWETIVTETNDGEPTHTVVEDEELIKELRAAIKNASFVASGFGCEVYSHNSWVLIDSNWQGTWATYEIMGAADYDCKQQNSQALPAIEG